MADLQQTVGTTIRRERRERHLTLKELAERSAISVVYLGEIERGKKYPSPLVLERLAEALDMSVSDLLDLIADALREAEQPVVVRAIGFRLPQRPEPSATPRAVNLLEPVTPAVVVLSEPEPALVTITLPAGPRAFPRRISDAVA